MTTEELKATLEERILVLKAKHSLVVSEGWWNGWWEASIAIDSAIQELQSMVLLLSGNDPEWEIY